MQQRVLIAIAASPQPISTPKLYELAYKNRRNPPGEPVIKVHVCNIRRRLGRETIQSLGGNGASLGLYYCSTQTKEDIKEWQDAQNDALRNRSRLGAETPGE